MMKNPQFDAVRSYIQSNWQNTIRSKSSLGPMEFQLPEDFTVPIIDSMFQPFPYWETYFTCEGLISTGRFDLALANTNNILALVDEFGFVPAFAYKEKYHHSQPPILSLLVRKIFENNRDKNWLSHALMCLEKEYSFWMTFRTGPHGINHYGWHGYPKDLSKLSSIYASGLAKKSGDPVEILNFTAHKLSEVESGWTFTSRFNGACQNRYAIDLNCLLFMLENNAAEFSEILDTDRTNLWRERALKRSVKINRLCWNDEKSFYFDFDFFANEQKPIETSAAFYALWAGLPSVNQATSMVNNLPHFEYDHGLVACRSNMNESGTHAENQIYQWDFPNAWPPIQFAAMTGLEKYGFTEEAQRIAKKYVKTVSDNFIQTGHLWEKYNAVTGGVDLYEGQSAKPRLGWTAGTYLHALNLMEK
jgi:alpha,alpha-trehalase